MNGQARLTNKIHKARQTKTKGKDTCADKLARNLSFPEVEYATQATAKDVKFHEQPNCPSKQSCTKEEKLEHQPEPPKTSTD